MVVDEWVDVHDYGQVMWQVGANVDPARDLELGRGPARPPRPRALAAVHGGKLGIDATAKGPQEGYLRGWPDVIEMTPEVRDQVTRRWAEFGISVTKADARGPR